MQWEKGVCRREGIGGAPFLGFTAKSKRAVDRYGRSWTGLHALIAGFAAAAAGPEEAGIEELLERLRMGIRKKMRVRAH